MATRKELDELIQYHNKENQEDKVNNNKWDRKHNNVNTNDDVDNWTTLEKRLEPIPFQQYQRWHLSPSSSSRWSWEKTGGAHIF